MPTSADPSERAFAPSYAQERLWFLEQLNGPSALYSIPLAFRLRGPVDEGALDRALVALVERHEALRTSFRDVDGRPMQVVRTPPRSLLELVDVTARAPAEREAEAERVARALALAPLRLDDDLPVRAALVRLAADDRLLVLVVHHIAVDSWSLEILYRELELLYRGARCGEGPGLAEPPLQYVDFAAWQREWLEGGKLDEDLSYWTSQLEGLPPLLELPVSRPRPPLQSFRGDVVSFEFGAEARAAVHRFARETGATPFAVLVAAYALVLARYTAELEVAIGTTAANRPDEALEDVVGFFANTIVLRLAVDPAAGFRRLVATASETVTVAYEHEQMPFERLVEALHPARTLSHTPLFQTMIVLEPFSEHLRLDDVEVTGVPLHTQSAKFDLLLTVQDDGRRLGGTFEYATDLFDRSAVERLADHFGNVLRAAPAAPDAPVGSVPITAAAERAALVRAARGPVTPPVPPFLDRIRRQIAAVPDSVAIEDASGALHYAELDARVRAHAAQLEAAGVGRGARIGVLAERSADAVAAILAILGAGAAYVPLDPSYPRERLELMADDAQISVVVAGEALAKGLRLGGATVLPVEAPPVAQKRRGRTAAPTGTDTAYVIYTSGSTGRPKGVAMTHACLSNLIDWQVRRLSGPARTAHFAPLAFDVSFQEIVATLASGGTLVVVPDSVRRDAAAFARLIRERSVTRIFLPFVALEALAEAIVADGGPTPLREVVTAGEQLRVTPAIAALFERIDGGYLENQYGPTETHVVTAQRLSGAPRSWPALPPIGTPIDNSEVYVLDERLEPQPVGLRGEIYVGGVSLAGGYLGEPAQTAERFVPNLLGAPGSRLYRTGDHGRLNDDGTIEFLGRGDDQVKIRGFRVELGEVEAVLAEHPAVRAAAAAATEGGAAGRRLVAWVVGDVDAASVRDWALTRLPEPMVPAVKVVDALPVTSSGKVDRRALVADEPHEVDTPSSGPPATATEQLVANLWRELLGVGRAIGVDDDFFDLGGHSLAATRLVSRLRRVRGVEVPLLAVFSARTVRALAAEVDAATQVLVRPPIRRLDRSRFRVD